MNIPIKIKTCLISYLENSPRAKQWLWFITLWFAGLFAVMGLTYPLKMLMNNL